MKSFFCFTLLSSLLFTLTQAATFEIRNSCPYTVWAAARPGGGRRLNSGKSWTLNVNPGTTGGRVWGRQSWTLNVNPGTTGGRVWGRTGCIFDAGGNGHCETGDCGGRLHCQGYGAPPNTLAEYTLNQFNNMDFYDISLVDGFNVPMEFSHIGGCKNIRCTADINGPCPDQLQAPGGCNNPCTVFKTNKYCCTNGPGSCGPTDLSKFFKTRCPNAYSYPQDDPTSLFTCTSGGNYRVVFCP